MPCAAPFDSSKKPTSWMAWPIVLIASLAFLMEFASMNIFNVISQQLIHHFNMSHTQLGWFSSVYFMANVLSIPVTGMLLDKYSAKYLLAISVVFSTLGLSLLGVVPFWAAVVLRGISGACNPLTILGAMRLAYRWLPSHRWGFASSVVISVGMLGGIFSQNPLAYFIQSLGWEEALLYFLPFGSCITLLILLLVREAPQNLLAALSEQRQNLNIKQGFKSVLSLTQNWLAGLFTAGMNAPIALFGGLWGVTYIQIALHIPHRQATAIASHLFLGAAIGGLVIGWLSDHWKRRKKTMLIAATLSLVLFADLIFAANNSVICMQILLFAIGFLSSAQDLSFAVVSESNPSQYTGMSLAMISLLVQSGSLFLQPLSGYLIDSRIMSQRIVSQLSDFNFFVWIFPIAALVALLSAFFLRETFCRPIDDQS